MASISPITNCEYKGIDHIAIATTKEKFNSTIKFLQQIGGFWYHTGMCEEFNTNCAFIRFNNVDVEVITGEASDKYARKFGGVVLHHLAIEGDGTETIKGAKPNMLIKFEPLSKTSILIEKVTYARNNVWDKLKRIF